MKERILDTLELDALWARECDPKNWQELTQARHRNTLSTLGQLLRINVKEFSIEDKQDGTQLIVFETEHMIAGTRIILESLRRDLLEVTPEKMPNFLNRARGILKGFLLIP